MEALGAIGIIFFILAILPYIAIVGTWNEITKARKELEEISEILITQSKIIDMRTQEIQSLQYNNNYISQEMPPVIRK